MHGLSADFGPAARAWFEDGFGQPTEIQRRGWERIARGEHALLAAPTGSGKTLAAFLWQIDALTRLADDAPSGVRVVYVSPLKALVADVERNLRAPLAGVLRAGEGLGQRLRPLRVDVRTGDTPTAERRRQARDPGEILVTTPESLFLILGSRQRETLRTVTTVIVDEIHALAPTKRGAHLALSLERLAELAEGDPQRIGLSATVRPLDLVARYLGGDRPVEIVDASAPPALELQVAVPVPDMEHAPPPPRDPDEGGPILAQLAQAGPPSDRFPTDQGPGARPGVAGERGLWPALYPELLAAIGAHRSTIVFVNSRGLCERLTQRLNELAGEEVALAHHGSVSHAKRTAIEDALKAGRVPAIVATSSLELGIDMGAVDLVILVESPGSVARGLQRVGRAGHGVGETSRGLVFPKFKGDLLECAVVARRMLAGSIEALEVPRNCLDVLAQQVVAICCDAPRTPAELARIARRSHTYAELSDEGLASVLEMLSGRYQSTDLADLRPRLRWDRARDVLSARPGAAMVSRINAGTIPDRGAFPVYLGDGGPRLGELDEEMVYETREGDTFMLGASTWRVESIDSQRVIVSPAPGEPGRLPFWRGDGPGRPVELGHALGELVRELGALDHEAATARIEAELPFDALAARNLADYLCDQREHAGCLPTDRAITVERFRDELGDWRVCILSPFGSRVHAPWAMALERRLSDRAGVEVELMYADDGIVLRFADGDELPPVAELFPEPEEVEALVTEQLAGTALFASLFRENAVRSLLVTRRRPDQRSPLWAQRRKAQTLLATVKRHPSFPVLLETYRHALADVFDLDGLRGILAAVRERRIRVDDVETRSASPFARSLVFAYVAAYLYDGDSPVAERKAQALTLDRELLRELLGGEELRELLDAEVLEQLEAELAGTAEDRRARDRDELHDLLRRLGDLSEDELAERAEADVVPWLDQLERERRAARVTLGGEPRWIAAEDAGLYRDALGAVPPAGLPSDFLAAPTDPLTALLRRFARGRGPFATRGVAARYGLTPALVEPALRALESRGELVLGALRPGGAELEWCDAEVLRRIKRRTLAALRSEVAPVDAATFARFLPRWHGLGPEGERRNPGGEGLAALEQALERLEGLALPWRALSGEVLAARVPGFRPDALDLLAAQGRLVWIGRGALGPGDGRVAVYRRERVAELAEPPVDYEPPTETHAALLAWLEERGAAFLTALERGLREQVDCGRRELEAALWDLVWAGLVTNDTFAPLRTLGRAPSKSKRAARGQALAGGRWSLVRELFAEPEITPTERALTRARALLERYGLVSREAARAEELAWGPLYRVLRTMEEGGQVRRGYFVEGLSGAQFATPGAADRLRAARTPEAAAGGPIALAAVDPACAYGGLFPWPDPTLESAPRPRRVAGARAILVDGAPALFVPPAGRRLATFGPPERVAAALELLGRLPRRGRGLLTIETLDGVPAEQSVHRGALERAGFVPDYKGYVHDPAAARRRALGGDGARA